jgi:hypothetical protein
MSIVFPDPTSPYMYRPLGSDTGIGGSAARAGLEAKKEKKERCCGWRDSIVGCWTGGGV